MKKAVNYLQEVKEQYEDFPYPLRDPQNEKQHILLPVMDMPERLNHYCFGGKQAFGKGFRILIAGGGTGDSTIYLAEQYGSLGAEIVHLDLSRSSIAVAKERARMRGIEKRINFLHASLLDIPKMSLGQFNFINCSGVLHHLANPQEGLNILAASLASGGAMSLMVYGQYGRHAIYPMQEAFKILLKNVPNKKDKISYGREVFAKLPANNWYQFSKDWFNEECLNDNGFYDLLLHTQDRAYTVPQLYEFIANAGLKGLSLQHQLVSGSYFYDPDRILTSPYLRAETAKCSLQERQALAEILMGDILKHEFFVSKEEFQEPDPKDEHFVPCIGYEKLKLFKEITETAISASKNFISYSNGTIHITLNLQPATAAILFAIDGKRSIRDIIEIITSRSDLTHEQVKQQFLSLYSELRPYDLLFLRHSSIAPFDDADSIQKKTRQRMGY